jgi:type II secretory pathway component PulF
METASLDDYVALNDQLAALVAAGVPLDVGLGNWNQPVSEALENINATVARRVRRGESLKEALEGDDHDLPPSYRSLVQIGLAGGNLSEALDDATRVSETADKSRFTISSSLIYPLIVCGLAYIGTLGLCQFFVPSLAHLYASMKMTPGPGLRVLEFVRDTRPIWGILIPMLLVLFISLRIRARARRRMLGVDPGRLLGWVPGIAKTLHQERCAHFASALAELLNDGTPLDKSLLIAGDASGDARLSTAARQLAAETQRGQVPGEDGHIALKFPPFLRWAIWHSATDAARAHSLEIAARVYRDSADRRTARLRVMAPVLAVVCVGGAVTLLYCLALFVPMVELLKKLAVGG